MTGDSLWTFRFHVRREWREPWETVEITAPSAAEAVGQLPTCVSWEFGTFGDGTYRRAA